MKRRSPWLLAFSVAMAGVVSCRNSENRTLVPVVKSEEVAAVGLPTYDEAALVTQKAEALAGGEVGPAPFYGMRNYSLPAIYWGMIVMENDLAEAVINENVHTNVHTLGASLMSLFHRERASGASLNIGWLRAKHLYGQMAKLDMDGVVRGGYLEALESLANFEKDFALDWDKAVDAYGARRRQDALANQLETDLQKKQREQIDSQLLRTFMLAKLEPLDASRVAALTGNAKVAWDVHHRYVQAGQEGEALFWGMIALENAGFQALNKAPSDRQSFQEAKLVLGTFLANLKGTQNHRRAKFWLASVVAEGSSFSSRAQSVLQAMPVADNDHGVTAVLESSKLIDHTPQVGDGSGWRMYWESVVK